MLLIKRENLLLPLSGLFLPVVCLYLFFGAYINLRSKHTVLGTQGIIIILDVSGFSGLPPLKPHSRLEPVLKCESSIYTPVSRWLSHSIIQLAARDLLCPTDRIVHTTAFVLSVVEHWLE